MRFNDLVHAQARPEGAIKVTREAIDTDRRSTEMPENDLRNAGFVRGLFDRKKQRVARTSRRGFLKGSVVAAGASVAAAASKLPGSPAKVAEAQGGVVGSYGYRIWTGQCPSFASEHNCEPGCGSTPVCTACCTANGYFRNDEAAGYRLFPGICSYGGGEAVDGWLWSYQGQCGGCSSILYRCHDGYVRRSDGLWMPSICRAVVQCGGAPDLSAPDFNPVPTTPPIAVGPTATPLPSQVSCPPGYTVVNTGQGYICQANAVGATPTPISVGGGPPAPTQQQCPDGYSLQNTAFGTLCVQSIPQPVGGVPTTPPVAPSPTPTAPFNGVFYISGSLESAIDNGGSVTIKGWVKGPTADPIEMRIKLDDSPAYVALANGYRPDVGQTIPNAGLYHGFEATINGVAPGTRQFCVYGVNGSVELQLSCVVVNVAPTASPTPLPPTSTPVPTTTPQPTSTPVAVPTPTATVVPPPNAGPNVALPPAASPSPNRPIGSVEVIRANTSGGGAFVSGWAGDADTGLSTIVVVSVDNVDVIRHHVSLSRPDVAAAMPQLGGNTGYALNVPFITSGTHTICVSLVDRIDGTRHLSGCRTVTGLITGSAVTTAPAATPTPTPTAVPVPTATPVPVATTAPPASAPSANAPAPIDYGAPVGALETLQAEGGGTVRLTGWMYFPADANLAAAYEVVVDGVTVGYGLADQERTDVGDALDVGNFHGFDATFEATPGLSQVEVYATSGVGRTGLLSIRTIEIR